MKLLYYICTNCTQQIQNLYRSPFLVIVKLSLRGGDWTYQPSPKTRSKSTALLNNCSQFVLMVPYKYRICTAAPFSPFYKTILGGHRIFKMGNWFNTLNFMYLIVSNKYSASVCWVLEGSLPPPLLLITKFNVTSHHWTNYAWFVLNTVIFQNYLCASSEIYMDDLGNWPERILLVQLVMFEISNSRHQ